MVEPIVYPIIGLSVVGVAAGIVARVVQYERRWKDADLLGGRLTRFVGVDATPELMAQVMIANAELGSLIKQRYPSLGGELDYRVEVVAIGGVRTETVPAGRLPNGEIVGGSLRGEQVLPFMKRHAIVVVQYERAASFIAHEVTRHLLPGVLVRDPDRDHKRKVFEALEVEAKSRIAGAIKTWMFERASASAL